MTPRERRTYLLDFSRRLILGVDAVAILYARSASALDPGRQITDYSITSWTEAGGPFPFGIYAIAQDHQGDLWLGARTGLIRFDGTSFIPWEGSSPLPEDRVSVIC